MADVEEWLQEIVERSTRLDKNKGILFKVLNSGDFTQLNEDAMNEVLLEIKEDLAEIVGLFEKLKTQIRLTNAELNGLTSMINSFDAYVQIIQDDESEYYLRFYNFIYRDGRFCSEYANYMKELLALFVQNKDRLNTNMIQAILLRKINFFK